MEKNYSKPEGYKNINQSQVKLSQNDEESTSSNSYYNNIRTYVISKYREINNSLRHYANTYFKR
jgi:hypothetical protein